MFTGVLFISEFLIKSNAKLSFSDITYFEMSHSKFWLKHYKTKSNAKLSFSDSTYSEMSHSKFWLKHYKTKSTVSNQLK
jgi:hypothetical protein